MNKHGQTLVLFVLLIPLIIILMAVIVDVGVVTNKKNHIKEVTKMVIKDLLKEKINESEAKELFLGNDILVDNLEIIKINKKIEIKNKASVKSIFGSIIGIEDYDIRISITGEYQNEKIIYE